MEESGLSPAETEEIRELIDRKDFVGVEHLVNSHAMPYEIKDIVLNLPGYFGSKELIEDLEQRNITGKALKALEYLKMCSIYSKTGVMGNMSLSISEWSRV